MFDGVFERGDQSLIFGEVIGLVAEIFAETRDLASGLVFDDDAVAGRTGIAAGPAIGVSDQIMRRRILAGLEQMFRCRMNGGFRRHARVYNLTSICSALVPSGCSLLPLAQ